MTGEQEGGVRWLLLIHQIPQKPAYLRVKIGRRLGRIGAVALKSTVYVLPDNDGAREDFQWILQEIASDGGEAAMLTASVIEGISNHGVEDLFRTARDADYARLAAEARSVEERLVEGIGDDEKKQLFAEVTRLERTLSEITQLDFFGASGRETAFGLIAHLRGRLAPDGKVERSLGGADGAHPCGRTWVTRTGVKVDRIASAWLVRRFIDPQCTFKFVPAQGYSAAPEELRFDMFEAEFSHEGDQCTFEVLCERFRLRVPGLTAISELIHDIDIKDGKFGRPETPGLSAQISGIAALHPSDEARIARGSDLFDALLAHFARQGTKT